MPPYHQPAAPTSSRACLTPAPGTGCASSRSTGRARASHEPTARNGPRARSRGLALHALLTFSARRDLGDRGEPLGADRVLARLAHAVGSAREQLQRAGETVDPRGQTLAVRDAHVLTLARLGLVALVGRGAAGSAVLVGGRDAQTPEGGDRRLALVLDALADIGLLRCRTRLLRPRMPGHQCMILLRRLAVSNAARRRANRVPGSCRRAGVQERQPDQARALRTSANRASEASTYGCSSVT